MDTKNMKIGQLANRAGLTTKTIRYYEEIGLLPEARRTETGYRMYTESDLGRLNFIKKARELGLSLAEAGWVLDLRAQSQHPCRHVLALLERKLSEIDSVIADLTSFRAEVDELRQTSAANLESVSDEDAICGIIETGIHRQAEAALVWLDAGNLTRSRSG
ncbi:MAG: heavy metal-responsive transcriptional regulator [Chloroflexi bacterium]|nr:heavy metal-responsive transcriptional regulator [Chloroflexota bacterium]